MKHFVYSISDIEQRNLFWTYSMDRNDNIEPHYFIILLYFQNCTHTYYPYTVGVVYVKQ